MPVTHYIADTLWGGQTACKRSLHGWNRNCLKLTTDNLEETTCKLCLSAMRLTKERLTKEVGKIR